MYSDAVPGAGAPVEGVETVRKKNFTVICAFKSLNPVYQAFRSTQNDKDNIVKVSGNLFNDWIPQKGKRKGAMVRFCEIAELDPRRALRDLWMYVSDNWFLDDDEEWMPLETNVSIALALCFFKSKDEAGFGRMAREIPVIYDMIKSHFDPFHRFSKGEIFALCK
jgi:hypothetical protein